MYRILNLIVLIFIFSCVKKLDYEKIKGEIMNKKEITIAEHSELPLGFYYCFKIKDTDKIIAIFTTDKQIQISDKDFRTVELGRYVGNIELKKLTQINDSKRKRVDVYLLNNVK